MATVYQVLEARAGIPAATNGAQHDVFSGTNFPVPVLAFDASTAESAYFYTRLIGYGSGNITAEIDWYADTDTTAANGVTWGCKIGCITPDTDTTNIETKALAAQTTGSEDLGSTDAQRVRRTPVTISNLDSAAAQDWLVLEVQRVVGDAGDDLTGDALLVMVTLSYSDT